MTNSDFLMAFARLFAVLLVLGTLRNEFKQFVYQTKERIKKYFILIGYWFAKKPS